MAHDNKAERQRAILRTAREIISTQGSGGLNMKELAQLANVPRASLYRAYSSKEHIIGDLTLEWGLSLVQRLQTHAPRGRSNGARIKAVFKSILQEAEDNPLLIGAVLDNLLSADDATRHMQIRFEALLPALLASAVDQQTIPDAEKVIPVLLRLLLANLQMQSAGRSTLNEALASMCFAAEKLMGDAFWAS